MKILVDKMPEENTQNMFKWLTNNINTLYKESPLKSLDEIVFNKQIEKLEEILEKNIN